MDRKDVDKDDVSALSGDVSASAHIKDSPEIHAKEFTLQATLAIVGAFFATFVTAGFANSFGVFQEYYGAHELANKSAFQIIWIASFQSFILFAFAPISGIMTDRIGPFVPLTFGAVAMLVSVFMTSLCTEYYQFFLAQGLLMGIGMSFLTIPSVATVSKSFRKNNGLAMGIIISGSSVGGVIWPIEADQLLYTHNLSFGWTMRVLGFTMLPICIFIPLAVRKQKTAQPATTAESAVVATNQDHVESANVKTTEAPITAKKQREKMDLSLIKKPTFLLLWAGICILFFGFWTPIFFLSSYGVSQGLTPSFSFYLISITMAGSFFGRVLPGFYADRYGPFNVLAISAVTSTVIAFCWTAATSTAGIVVWGLAYGFSSGSFLSLQATCASRLSTHETRGMAVGLIMGGGAISGLFGPPISGALEPMGYLPLSMFVGAVLVVGSALILGARLAQEKRLRAVV